MRESCALSLVHMVRVPACTLHILLHLEEEYA